MTDATMAQRFRLAHVLAFRSSGLSQRAYCRRPGTPSRGKLREYLARWAQAGEAGLHSSTPPRCAWNRTPADDEARILEHVRAHPADGPQTIAWKLRGQLTVGHNGVHGVLTRRGLQRRRAREEWSRVELGEVVTKSELETARERAKTRHVEVTYPGELWGQDTFLIGRLKGIGVIYHHLAVDIASSYAIARLYTGRTAENALDFLDRHLVPKASVGVHSLLQDNGTEFTAARWRDAQGHSNHPFERRARELGIRTKFIRPGHAWTNGSCERLHQTLLHEFYIPALCRKLYTAIEDLDYELQLYLAWYNHQRPHQGFRLRGKTPAEVYFSGKTKHPDLTLRWAA